MNTTPSNSENSNRSDNRAFATLFEDPAIAEAAKNDPLFRGLAKYWRSLLVIILAGVGANIAYSRYVTTRQNKLAEATQVLSDIRASYQEVVTKQAALDAMPTTQPAEKEAYEKASKELVDLKQKTQLKIDALTSPAPFDSLARVYKGLLAAKSGDVEGVHAGLVSFSWETMSPGTGERFVAEMGALALAKSLVTSEKYRAEARDVLTRLARTGETAAPQAARALAVQAHSAEEKDAASVIVKEVLQRYPEQAKFLSETSAEDASEPAP